MDIKFYACLSTHISLKDIENGVVVYIRLCRIMTSTIPNSSMHVTAIDDHHLRRCQVSREKDFVCLIQFLAFFFELIENFSMFNFQRDYIFTKFLPT